jgi:hypothetical protein
VACMGDEVCLDVWASAACRFYLAEQDSSGALCPLVPANALQADACNALRARSHRIVPDREDGDEFNLIFVPPVGLERVFVLATRAPMHAWLDAAQMDDADARTAALLDALWTHAVAAKARRASCAASSAACARVR